MGWSLARCNTHCEVSSQNWLSSPTSQSRDLAFPSYPPGNWHIQSQGTFEDDFIFSPMVGYVTRSSLEGKFCLVVSSHGKETCISHHVTKSTSWHFLGGGFSLDPPRYFNMSFPCLGWSNTWSSVGKFHNLGPQRWTEHVFYCTNIEMQIEGSQ